MVAAKEEEEEEEEEEELSHLVIQFGLFIHVP